MSTERGFRKTKGTTVLLSETARRAQAAKSHRVDWHRRATPARTMRNGWSTFEKAPKVDEFDSVIERLRSASSITPPRRKGKPGGASIHVPEGEWSVVEQLREDREL